MVEKYKAIPFTDVDYKIIAIYLDNNLYLYQTDSASLTNFPNLLHAREIQIRIIKQLNKYGFGFTDAIEGRHMNGTADLSATGEPIYNDKLDAIVKNAKVTITNGINEKKKGTVGAFRMAVGLYGKRLNSNWAQYKIDNNVVQLPSSSGACHSNSHSKSFTDEEKMDEWYNEIKKYF